MYCSLKTDDIYFTQNYHYQKVGVIFKQKPVFMKIINAVIYMYPLKEQTYFWRAAGTEGCQSIYIHYFVLVSYSSFKLGIFIAYRF